MPLFATKHSHAEIYLHAIWTTLERAPLLTDELIAKLSQQAGETAEKVGAQLIAFGGVPDHVHVLLRHRPDLDATKLVRTLKASLTHVTRRDESDLPHFSWQSGYGAFSVSRSDVDSVAKYVTNQAKHHASRDIWPDVEPIE